MRCSNERWAVHASHVLARRDAPGTRMNKRSRLVILAVVSVMPACIPSVATAQATAVANDNRVAAGRLIGRRLELELEAREVRWSPEGTHGVTVPVYAFAVANRTASVPGPMIRVPEGTTIDVAVRNTLGKAVHVRGLRDHANGGTDSVVIGPGERRAWRFKATTAGTYYYWGRTDPLPAYPGPGRGRDGTLVGALIVDSAGARPSRDRVLVITTWTDTSSELGVKSVQADRIMRREMFPRATWAAFTVNGRSWPHTERLSYTAGDTVHWRVINASRTPHPMHLHGFHFDVTARGDGIRDTVYRVADRRTVVTEWMVRGTTMSMSWVAARPGNWLFHCHIVQHITDAMRLPAPSSSGAHRASHAHDGMAGLVTGIHVAPARRTTARDAPARRKLRLTITERANVYGGEPAHSYVLQEGPHPPSPDSIRPLSSTIMLMQGEPTEITVVNASSAATSIHWHGIELESFYDGVGGWSGWRGHVAPSIAPRDSFRVRITAPRAGTFMYHTHADEGIKLVSGQYGALVVTPKGAGPDTTDRLFVFAIGGPHEDARPLVNGSTSPGPLELRAGVAHRLRFINISPLETNTVQLIARDSLQRWRLLAKDGAELPPHRATSEPGVLVVHPGETFDVEVRRDEPSPLTLRVLAFETITNRLALIGRPPPPTPPRIVMDVPVIVR